MSVLLLIEGSVVLVAVVSGKDVGWSTGIVGIGRIFGRYAVGIERGHEGTHIAGRSAYG